MENPIIIFGAGGLGKVALEIFESNGIVVYGFLDDSKEMQGKQINGISVLGNTDDDGFLKLIGKKCESFVALDETKYRENIVEMLYERRSVIPINAFHKRSYLSSSVELGHGNMFCADVIINVDAKLGSHCVFHTKSLVEFDSEIGDFVQVGSGSIVGAGSKIGDKVFIGSGVTIVSGISIGKNARIGAGSVVVENVPANATYFGNPAKKV